MNFGNQYRILFLLFTLFLLHHNILINAMLIFQHDSKLVEAC